MHQLTYEIIDSRDWRVRELENLKKVGIILLGSCSEKIKNQYYRMCVPYIYAHWEGFVVESFKCIISYLNNLQLKRKDVRLELYAFSLQDVIRPLSGKQSFNQTCQFIEKFEKNYNKDFYLDPKLLTVKSNLNYKQLERIIDQFGMKNNFKKYKIEINELVNRRNRIAHGENGIEVNINYITNIINMFQEIFDILILEYENYLVNNLYLKKNTCEQ